MARRPSHAGLEADKVARLLADMDRDDDPVTVPAAPLPPISNPAPPPEAGDDKLDPGKVDGRTLRRTGRVPIATRVKPETHEMLRRLAHSRGTSIAEVIETAVAEFARRNHDA